MRALLATSLVILGIAGVAAGAAISGLAVGRPVATDTFHYAVPIVEQQAAGQPVRAVQAPAAAAPVPTPVAAPVPVPALAAPPATTRVAAPTPKPAPVVQGRRGGHDRRG